MQICIFLFIFFLFAFPCYSANAENFEQSQKIGIVEQFPGVDDFNGTSILPFHSSNAAPNQFQLEFLETVNASGRGMFKALDNGKPKKTVAFDWETGEELTKEMTKEKQLFVSRKSGLLTFNAKKQGTTQPIQLPFDFEHKTIQTESGKWLYLDLKICLRKGKSCNDGSAICYVGQMDPANRPLLLDHLKVPNLQDLPDFCKNEKLEGWDSKTLHAIFVKVIEEWRVKKIELSTSFSSQKQKLELDKENCAFFKIAVDDTTKLGEKDNTWTHLAQAGQLVELPFQKILPFDVFSDFGNLTGDFWEMKPLFAFAGTEDCDLEISIDGPFHRCVSKKCDQKVVPVDPKVWFYEEMFDNLKPVYNQKQVPGEFAKEVTFQMDKNRGKPWIWIGDRGREIVFAILTATSKPPMFTVFRPPFGDVCTAGKKADDNKFLLSYNADPNCFVRIAWEKTALIFGNEKSIEHHLEWNYDVPIMMKGRGFYAVHSTSNTTKLVTGNCNMEGHKLDEPIENEPNHVFLWKFILNPEETVKKLGIRNSICRVGIAFYSDENVLLLPSTED